MHDLVIILDTGDSIQAKYGGQYDEEARQKIKNTIQNMFFMEQRLNNKIELAEEKLESAIVTKEEDVTPFTRMLLEPKEGAHELLETTDISATSVGVSFKCSDGRIRQILFNADGTCTWRLA